MQKYNFTITSSVIRRRCHVSLHLNVELSELFRASVFSDITYASLAKTSNKPLCTTERPFVVWLR